MLNVAAALGGGVLLKQNVDSLGQKIEGLPKLRRTSNQQKVSFRLSVRIVAASIPALAKPGFWSRQRPRLEVTLDKVKKETELADFAEGGGAEGPSAGACASECPWRFGDTLTFIVSLKDVLGPGLKLRLSAQSDITVGPVQFQLSQVAEIGEARVDIRSRALPGCVPARRRQGGAESWDSPVLLVPLAHVRGGLVGDGQELGNAVAHVALAFSTDADPDLILDAADAETRTVRDVLQGHANNVMGHANNVMGHANNVMRWLHTPMDLGKVLRGAATSISREAEEEPRGGYYTPPRPDPLRTLTPRSMERAVRRARSRPDAVPSSLGPLPDPEEAPEGWVSRKGPDGRVYWHHRRLGPAPWEEVDSL